jgi:hypothetical protein
MSDIDTLQIYDNLVDELDDLWDDDTHLWKFKKVMLSDLVEDLQYHDKAKGNYWLAKVWFKDFLQDIKIVVGYKGHPNDMLFVDSSGKIWMKQDSANGWLRCRYTGLWQVFYTKYDIDCVTVQEIVKDVIEEHFGVSVGVPLGHNTHKYSMPEDSW